MHAVVFAVFSVLVVLLGVDAFISTTYSPVRGLRHRELSMFDVGHIHVGPLEVAGALGLLLGGFQFSVYWRMQFVAANMFGRIPEGSTIAELDAKDGKNIFYLPRGIDYTAIMAGETKPDKEEEKLKLDNQLVLESIGKANQNGLNLRGKVRRSSRQVDKNSLDAVISAGALGRAKPGQDRVRVVKEAYRMLRPGGLLIFVEPGRPDRVVADLEVAFQETIFGGVSGGEKLGKAKRAAKNKHMRQVKGKGKGKDVKRGTRAVLDDELEAVSCLSRDSGSYMNDENKGDKVNVDVNVDVDVENMYADTRVDGDVRVAVKTGVRAAEKGIGRPGITWERFDHLNLLPFVTGIAVKP